MALHISAMEPMQVTLGCRCPSSTTKIRVSGHEVPKSGECIVVEKLCSDTPSPNSSFTLSEFIDPSPENFPSWYVTYKKG